MWNQAKIVKCHEIKYSIIKNQTQIKCPNCGTSIDVQDILAHPLEEEIKQRFQSQLAEKKKKYESEVESLNQAREEFEQKKKQENELFQERLDKQLKREKEAIEVKLKAKLELLLSRSILQIFRCLIRYI